MLNRQKARRKKAKASKKSKYSTHSTESSSNGTSLSQNLASSIKHDTPNSKVKTVKTVTFDQAKPSKKSQLNSSQFSVPLKRKTRSAKAKRQVTNKRKKQSHSRSNKSHNRSVSGISRNQRRVKSSKKSKSVIKKLSNRKKQLEQSEKANNSKSVRMMRKKLRKETEMLPINLKNSYKRLANYKPKDINDLKSEIQDSDFEQLFKDKEQSLYEVQDTYTPKNRKSSRAQEKSPRKTYSERLIQRNKPLTFKRAVEPPTQALNTPRFQLQKVEILREEQASSVTPESEKNTKQPPKFQKGGKSIYDKNEIIEQCDGRILPPSKEYISIQSSFRNTKYYKSSLSKYYIKQMRHNPTTLGGIYYEHFKDSCEILREKKFWRVKKMATANTKTVDLAQVNLEKGKVLVLDMDECLLHSQFSEIFRAKNGPQLRSVKESGFWMDIDDKSQCWVSFYNFPFIF